MGIGDIADDISGNGKTIVITSLVMLIVFVAVSTLVFFISLKSAEQVMVPNVVGKDLPEALRRHVQVLAEWEKQPALSWAVEGDKVDVWDSDGDIRGRIRAEYLTIGNHTFILNDLTGAV